MTALTIKGFRGEVPRMSPRLLQPNQATRAHNLKMTSGRLDPLPATMPSAIPGLATAQTIARYRHFAESGAIIDNWLAWASDVDFVPTGLANDTLGRFYFSSDAFEPRMSTYADAVAGQPPYPNGWYVLGVPNPTNAPTVTITGGSGNQEARAYIYTFVTRYGEESGISLVSNVATGAINGTWTVSGMQTSLPNSGTITAVANSTPSFGFVRLTLNTAVGLEKHETLTISGVNGMTALNGTHRIVSVNLAANQIVLALTTAQTYTSGGTWSRAAPHNVTGMTKRIYRSAGTNAQFQFVAEVPLATTSYVDAVTAVGETVPTFESLPPPKNLRCLISLPNGCLVGLADNELCFSAPYLPYSWPDSNRYSFAGRGVAIIPVGNSVIVLTDGFPLLFTGSDPEAMSPSSMETYAPCVSKRGTVNIGGGGLYPSHDGLWLATAGRVEKVTSELYRETDWAKLNPTSFVADFHDGQYMAAFAPVEGEPMIFIMDLAERDSVSFVEESPQQLLRNEYDGKMYLLKDGRILQWEGSASTSYSCDWISATLQIGKPTNFSIAQIHGEFAAPAPPDTSQIDANAALIAQGADAVAGHLNGHEVLEVEINGSYVLPAVVESQKKVQFTLYVDGSPVFTRDITNSQPFRLPGGYRAETFNIGLNTTVPVYSVSIAQSGAELAATSA
jgi:hypothetical protein